MNKHVRMSANKSLGSMVEKLDSIRSGQQYGTVCERLYETVDERWQQFLEADKLYWVSKQSSQPASSRDKASSACGEQVY